MKKETIVTKIGKFTDFNGVEREYVIAAVSEMLPETDFDKDLDTVPVICEHQVMIVREDDMWAVEDLVVKRVSLGLAVRNAQDVFDVKIGTEIAVGKARKRPIGVLYATRSGMINKDMVDALIKQESTYFEQNPGAFLAGYNKAARKKA